MFHNLLSNLSLFLKIHTFLFYQTISIGVSFVYLTFQRISSLFKIPLLVVLKVGKLPRYFLWSRIWEEKSYHLVSWDAVRRLKEFGGLGLGKTYLRTCALFEK